VRRNAHLGSERRDDRRHVRAESVGDRSLLDHEDAAVLREDRGEGELIVRLEETTVDDADVDPLGRELLRGLERGEHHRADREDRELGTRRGVPKHLPRSVGHRLGARH
jgi:hypothetical protein